MTEAKHGVLNLHWDKQLPILYKYAKKTKDKDDLYDYIVTGKVPSDGDFPDLGGLLTKGMKRKELPKNEDWIFFFCRNLYLNIYL